jgi:16S rRNA (guanine966-N2)-methyltransferase
MRIVAGRFRGRQVELSPHSDARPTSERAREALFSILGARVDGAQVLDLFAGSGALGFEALSRGARNVLFVESDRASADRILDSAKRLACGRDEVEVWPFPVARALDRLQRERRSFGIIVADPPWNAPTGLGEALRAERLLAPGGTFALELGFDGRGDPAAALPGEGWSIRRWGRVGFALRTAAEAPAEPSKD